jgi:peptidoglycan/xylan/chitin deacetylase (PgdA/CDA1 family)
MMTSQDARDTLNRRRGREFLKDLGKRVAGEASAGLNHLLGSRAEASLGILVYHRVSPVVSDIVRPSMNVPPRRFQEQLTGLLGRGFSFWPLRQVLDYHERGLDIPPRTAVVTFDDGFEYVYTRAWPILRELQIPATVFVATAFLDSTHPFPFDTWALAYHGAIPPESYRPLTLDQCREMCRDGLVELGAHTHTHQDFRRRPEEFQRDLLTSVDVLRSRFGIEEPTFAFPFGRRYSGFSGDDLVKAARQAGVRCGLTTEADLVDPTTDPFGWGRFNAYDWDTAATLSAKLQGWYSWAPRLQEWLSRRK